MSQPIERLWIPHPGHWSPIDDGFLSEPQGPLAGLAPATVRLSEIDARCVALIGEPGLGKTTALKAETVRVALQLGSNDRLLSVDLGTTRDETLLQRKIFGSPEWTDWERSDGVIYLYLDAFDEARMRIDTVADLLQEGLATAAIERLVLRLTCRTADRLSGFEDYLKGRFGADDFLVLELAPLTKAQVMQAALDHGLQGTDFLQQILDRQLQPLAMIPMTLQMLLDKAVDGEELPRSRVELYREATLRLCEDTERREGLGARRLPPTQRLAIARRIAGAVVLSARQAVRIDNASGTRDEVALNELAGGTELDRELALPRSFDVTIEVFP